MPVEKVRCADWASYYASVANLKAPYSFVLPAIMSGMEVIMQNEAIFELYCVAFSVNAVLFLAWYTFVRPSQRSASWLSHVLTALALVNWYYTFSVDALLTHNLLPVPTRVALLFVMFCSFGTLPTLVCPVSSVVLLGVGQSLYPNILQNNALATCMKCLFVLSVFDFQLQKLMKTTLAEMLTQKEEKDKTRLDAGKQIIQMQAHDLKHFVQVCQLLVEEEISEGRVISQRTQKTFEDTLEGMRLTLDCYLFGASSSNRAGNADSKDSDVKTREAKVSLDVRQLAERLLATTKMSRLASSSIQTAVQVIGDLPQLMLEPRAIQQVIANALFNSFKFTVHGSISVALEYIHEAHLLRIQVKDTGPGLTQYQEEHLTNLFAGSNQLGGNYDAGGFIMKHEGSLQATRRQNDCQHKARRWNRDRIPSEGGGQLCEGTDAVAAEP
jgi:hypothetical protein